MNASKLPHCNLAMKEYDQSDRVKKAPCGAGKKSSANHFE
jgi:hypothetical protein